MKTQKLKFSKIKNKTYKSVDSQDICGDLYIPVLPGLKPAVLVVHGGGWSSRSGEMTSISKELARSGFVVFNITYRLAPQSLYPKAIEDVTDALQFLRDHSAEYEIDPYHISGWGYSAGAHLALMLGLNPKNKLRAVVAGGAPTDFSAWPNSPIIKKFIGGSLSEMKEVWEQASPVKNVVSNSSPVFLYHGSWDKLVEVEQMYKMENALKEKNVRVQVLEMPFTGHITAYLFSSKAVRLGIDFINGKA